MDAQYRWGLMGPTKLAVTYLLNFFLRSQLTLFYTVRSLAFRPFLEIFAFVDALITAGLAPIVHHNFLEHLGKLWIEVPQIQSFPFIRSEVGPEGF